MLIVLAKATVSATALSEAMLAIDAMVNASRAEPGCIAYSFTQEVLDPATLHIVEKWQDDAALASHFTTPHMAAFQAAIAGLDLQVTEALKYHSDGGASLF